MHRAPVSSDFFDIEDVTSSSSPAVVPHPHTGRHGPLSSAPVALFDVGRNAVPSPRRNDIQTGLNNDGSNHISLAEVSGPTPSFPDNAAKGKGMQDPGRLPMGTLLEQEV